MQKLKVKLAELAPQIVVPIGAVLLALLFGSVMLMVLGADPLESYAAMYEGAFGSVNAIADTLVRATPLLFVGVGICIAFRGGVINIGGEGQLIMGALGCTVFVLNAEGLPGWLIIPLGMLCGFLAGAIYGGIAGYLKARLDVNEILTTIMLNVIAVQLMNYLLAGPLIAPRQVEMGTRIPETARFTHAADLPRMVPTRLHAGAGVALVIAILAWVLLWRTTIGYRIRAVGLNYFASRYAGIPVQRYALMALTLSGALAGLAGAVQVLGLHHRMFTDGSAAGFTGSAGFNGIVAALFGALHPLGTIPASVLFGGLLVGANKLQRVAQVPSALAITLNGLVVVFVVASQIWRHRQFWKVEKEVVAEERPDAPSASASEPEDGA